MEEMNETHVRRIKIAKNGSCAAGSFCDMPSDEYLISHTAQLLGRDGSNKVVSLASAALVDWGCETYVLTAGHCARPNMMLQTGEGLDGVGYGIPLGPFYVFSHMREGGMMTPNGGVIDFAYTKIEQGTVARRKVFDGHDVSWTDVNRIGPAFPSCSDFLTNCAFAGVVLDGKVVKGNQVSYCVRVQRKMKLTALVDGYTVMEFPFVKGSPSLNAHRYEGCSGAPIFNCYGNPIAIVAGMIDNILYGVPLSYVWDNFVMPSESGSFHTIDGEVVERADGHLEVKGLN